MSFSPPPSADVIGPVTSDTALRQLVHGLVGPAIRPQVWLLFLDADDRPLPLLVALDWGLGQSSETETDALAARAHEAARHIGAMQVVAVWERDGPARLRVGERWAVDRLAARFPRGRTRLRAQFLSHTGGVVRV